MRVTPVRAERLSDKVVRQILGMIHDGDLQPGVKLPTETQFAEQFGVSRGVIREAMTQLQAQGYVRRRPKDGTYIQEDVQDKFTRPVSDALKKATYLDLLDFRESLETRMVEIVVERASDEEIEEIVESLTGTDDGSEPSTVDHYFHYKLAQASKNVFYMNFIDTYYDLIEEMAQQNMKDQQRSDLVAEEHAAIARAIARRDKDAAREAMAYHMRMVRKAREAQEDV